MRDEYQDLCEKIIDLENRIDRNRSEVQQLNHDINALRDDIKGLVEAWRTAGGVVKFVKILAGLVAAIMVLFKFGSMDIFK